MWILYCNIFDHVLLLVSFNRCSTINCIMTTSRDRTDRYDYFFYKRSRTKLTEVFTAPCRHHSNYIRIHRKSFLLSERTKKEKYNIVFCSKSRYNHLFSVFTCMSLFHRRVVVLQIAFLRISAIFRNCFIFLSAGGVSVAINWTAQIFSHEIQL